MRPPEFTGGNPLQEAGNRLDQHLSASMRPPEFTGGNAARRRWGPAPLPRFNEAAGIHRRKHLEAGNDVRLGDLGFNEAAGIHRRKPLQRQRSSRRTAWRFNEAAGIHRRKPALAVPAPALRPGASMRPPEFTGGNAEGPGGVIVERYTLQ